VKAGGFSWCCSIGGGAGAAKVVATFWFSGCWLNGGSAGAMKGSGFSRLVADTPECCGV